MRLQWWICGRSVSVCLTLWCISTGLNPFSITCVSPLLSLSPFLFPSFFSFPHFQWWGTAWPLVSVMEHTPACKHITIANNKTTKRNWAHNLPIDFYWGQFCNSLSDLLAKWWWTQDRRCRLCQHLESDCDTSLLHWRQLHGLAMDTSIQIQAQPEEKCLI